MTKQQKQEMFMMGKRAEERADRFMEWHESKNVAKNIIKVSNKFRNETISRIVKFNNL